MSKIPTEGHKTKQCSCFCRVCVNLNALCLCWVETDTRNTVQGLSPILLRGNEGTLSEERKMRCRRTKEDFGRRARWKGGGSVRKGRERGYEREKGT